MYTDLMKKLMRRVLINFGFDIVRIGNSNENLSKHLLNVLVYKNIECVIDVGSNSGQYGMFLRGIGYKGHIVSFEPVNSVFNILEESCDQDDKWSCHNIALGDMNGEKMMNVYKSTVFSSFLKANEYSKNIWDSLRDVTQENVKVSMLDDVYEDMIGSLGCANHMLKLDTQGYDKYVFDGARGCLKNISVLQSELSLIPIYSGMHDVYDVLKEYNEKGFYISGLYPINRDESLAVIEYDCVLVRR